MLVTRFETAARFIGRLDQGQDISAGFKIVCRENSIRCAWVNASALIRGPIVALPGTGGVGTATPLDSVCFCPSLTGNVSVAGEDTVIKLYGECRPIDGSAPVAGLIEGGEVIFCEFLVTTCDDASLVRDRLAPFAPWVQLQPTAPEVLEPQPMVQRPTPVISQPAVSDDEATELNILEMKAGDYVDHPRFGVCRIAGDPQEDKISIKLSTGKQVDLSLGIMRVLEPKMLGARRVFKLEIRKRNG
jgi:hypothetical protein